MQAMTKDSMLAALRARIARIEGGDARIRLAAVAETGAGGKKRRENPDQKRARDAVTKAINRAIKEIEKAHKPCGKYLHAQVKKGFFLQYRDTAVAWET